MSRPAALGVLEGVDEIGERSEVDPPAAPGGRDREADRQVNSAALTGAELLLRPVRLFLFDLRCPCFLLAESCRSALAYFVAGCKRSPQPSILTSGSEVHE